MTDPQKAERSIAFFVLLLACAGFLIYRWCILIIIYSNRELPIEPDDSLIYMLNIKLAFTMDHITDETFQSAREFSKMVFLDQGSELAPQVLSWINGVKYFAFSHLMQILAYTFNLSYMTLIIGAAYAIQPLALVSFVLFCRFYVRLPFETTILATFLFTFTTIENIHVLMATPFSFSVIFVLFAAALQKSKYFVSALTLYMLAIIFHPGAVLGIFLIFSNDCINQISKIKKSNCPSILSTLVQPQLALPAYAFVLTYILNYFVSYVSAGATLLIMDSSPFREYSTETANLILLNIYTSFKYIFIFLSKFTSPILATALVIWSFFNVAYVKKTRILLVAWSIGTALTWFHMMPTHPGALTTYNLQYFAVVISIYCSQILTYYYHDLHSSFKSLWIK